MKNLLMRMFGCSRGLLGRFGGIIMARTNEECGNWVVSLLEVQSADSVLEIGFGPGVAIKRLLMLADRVAGVDPSPEMIAQAQARNAPAVATGRVELRRGAAARLPFESNTFDKAVAVNSMQVWPDAIAGLRELRRVTRRLGGSRLYALFGSEKRRRDGEATAPVSSSRMWSRRRRISARSQQDRDQEAACVR